MTTRGAAPPPSSNPRPTDPYAAAIYDAKNAKTSAQVTLAAAKLNELVKDAAQRGEGDRLALNTFRNLQGADRAVIEAFADLVINDSSYSLKDYQAETLRSFARAAMGEESWPGGSTK